MTGRKRDGMEEVEQSCQKWKWNEVERKQKTTKLSRGGGKSLIPRVVP